MIKKVSILILVMVILSYIGQTLAARLYSFQTESFSHGLILIKDNLGFIILSNIVLYLLDMFRLSLIGAALKMKFSFKDSFGAVALNIMFGWLSPAAILGAPAMAYYLYKRGYPLVESITVAFVRSFSIILVSALTTIVIYAFELQGQVINIVLQEKIFQVLVGISIYIFAVVFLSYVPFPFIKKVKALDKITSQIRLFLSEGKLLMVPVLVITLAMNFLLVSFIPYVSAHYYPDYGPLLSQTMLFLSYMLLMPTPGASGLAEVGAPMFFQGAFPLNQVVSTVTAMRVSTISLQIAVGILFMVFMMREKLSFADLKKFKKEI